MAASLREHVDLVIDRDHQTDLAPAGTPVLAAGWMKRLFEKDGGVWAEVEWTPAAAQQIKDKEYRYFSPTFLHDKSGTVTQILRGSLTNSPNFNMKAVASAQHTFQNPDPEEETETMNKTLLAIALAFGLSAPKTEEEVLALATAKAAELDSAKEFQTSTAKALGLKEDEKSETVLATASTIKATADAKSESTSGDFVPMDQFKATATALTNLQNFLAEEKATAAVEKAVAEGKITPANKDWYLGIAKSDLKKFENFAATAAVIVTPGQKMEGTPATGKEELDDEDKQMCAALGISHDDFKKAGQQQ